MWNLARLEKVLLHWLEQSQLLWVQWVYAFWQFIRANPFALLILSAFPFYVRQKLKKRTVVVVDGSRDQTFEGSEDWRAHPIIDMEIIPSESYPPGCCYDYVKHNGYYYISHCNNLRQLAKCSELYGENVIFVDRLLAVSGSVAVGRLISRTEAYEKLMSKRYYLSKGPKYVVPTSLDYFDYSSKFWGILSTIPILLQARNYNKSSPLLSLLIILLDYFRGPLYRLYDRLFNCFTRFVKLNIFKTRTRLYDFFSIFSSRWRYSDPVKKCAYVAQPGDTMQIMCYFKLRSMDDIKIFECDQWIENPADDNIFMAILPENSDYRAECSVIPYTEFYERAVLMKHVYVP